MELNGKTGVGANNLVVNCMPECSMGPAHGLALCYVLSFVIVVHGESGMKNCLNRS